MAIAIIFIWMKATCLRNLSEKISGFRPYYSSLCTLSVEQKPLEVALNYQFTEPRYLRMALIHPSQPSAILSNVSEFGRLEFLGDRVLNFIVSEYLFKSCSDEKEGILSDKLSLLVSNESCVQIAKFIELDLHLKAVHSSQNSRILADGVEALLGAVYLDGGLEACRPIIINSWIPFLEGIRDDKYAHNAKSDLQKWLHSQNRTRLPIYVTEDIGSSIEPHFRCTVKMGHEWPLFSGHGNSKKAAEQMAARTALDWIHARDNAATTSLASSPSSLSPIVSPSCSFVSALSTSPSLSDASD